MVSKDRTWLQNNGEPPPRPIDNSYQGVVVQWIGEFVPSDFGVQAAEWAGLLRRMIFFTPFPLLSVPWDARLSVS